MKQNEQLILIPGAWSDKSIWNSLMNELSKFQVDCHTITLSGLENRIEAKHVDLKTHVDDVVSFIDALKLEKTYIVGHSYSGFVASLVANQFPEKVSGLIFIEAFLPENGKSLLETAGLDVVEEINNIKRNKGNWSPPTNKELKSQSILSEEHIDYLSKQMTDHPGKTVMDKAEIKGNNLNKLNVSYIGSNLSETIKINPHFGKMDFYKFEGGHWPMLAKPEKLARVIDKILNRYNDRKKI